jgi:hypothetical protein
MKEDEEVEEADAQMRPSLARNGTLCDCVINPKIVNTLLGSEIHSRLIVRPR